MTAPEPPFIAVSNPPKDGFETPISWGLRHPERTRTRAAKGASE